MAIEICRGDQSDKKSRNNRTTEKSDGETTMAQNVPKQANKK